MIALEGLLARWPQSDLAGRSGETKLCALYGTWCGDGTAFFNISAKDVRWTLIGTTPISHTYTSKRDFREGPLNPLNERLAAMLRPTVQNVFAEATTLLIMSTMAPGAVERTVRQRVQMHLGPGVGLETSLVTAIYSTEDKTEEIAASLEKHEASGKGRSRGGQPAGRHFTAESGAAPLGRAPARWVDQTVWFFPTACSLELFLFSVSPLPRFAFSPF